MSLFNKEVLIYVPAYNCEQHVVPTLAKIPAELQAISDIVVVDNCSSDGTSDAVLRAQSQGAISKNVTLVKCEKNLGYSGSQKLAYSLALESPSVRWVMMLHGDGQYPPELLRLYLPYLKTRCAVAYGYRSKSVYGNLEETSLLVWIIIKTLSLIESLVTGFWRREWHTGFMMYSTEFLRELDLNALTSTPHIDGHLLYASGALRKPVVAVPIYKLYKELTAFEGQARRQYVLDVIRLMFAFKKIAVKRTQASKPFTANFRILAGSKSCQDACIK